MRDESSSCGSTPPPLPTPSTPSSSPPPPHSLSSPLLSLQPSCSPPSSDEDDADEFPWLEEAKSIGLALWGGARYGIKIRFPHALVMTLLFRRGRDKMGTILRLTREHATHLATFATLYKSMLLLLKWIRWRQCLWRHLEEEEESNEKSPSPPPPAMVLQPPGIPQQAWHSLVAGAVGGYVIWGRYSSVTHQVLLYLSSRVAAAGVQWIRQQVPASWTHRTNAAYPCISATVWGLVMFLFEQCPHLLHPSLRSSMVEIYRADQQWENNNERRQT